MTIVKVWGVHIDDRGDMHLRVTHSIRFRWVWSAVWFAGWCSTWVTICTLHDEADQSNVVPLRRDAA